MATISGSVSQRSDSYSFYIEWSESDIDTANNTSKVTATAYISCSKHNAWQSGLGQKLVIDGTEFTDTISVDLDPGVTVTLISGSKTITHGSDGSKSITISAECDLPYGDSWGPDWGSASGAAILTTIPRYMDYVYVSQRAKSSSSISLDWSCSHARDWTQYSINGGAWTDAADYVNSGNKSGYFTVSGLSANTNYSFKVRVRRTDSGLWSESDLISIRTHQTTVASIWLEGKGIDWITVTSSCNVYASYTHYRIRQSGGSYGSWQTSSTFTGLSPNTTYIIQVEKYGSESGEYGYAEIIVSTYDIAKLTSYPDFNLGDDVTIKFSNPSGSKIAVGIYKIGGAEALAPYRTVSGTSYTFKFTDEELDNMYRSMNGNLLEMIFYINTNDNVYRDYHYGKIYLTGNQKTVHIEKDGEVKRGKVFIARNGIKRGVLWRGVNGTARRCI